MTRQKTRHRGEPYRSRRYRLDPKKAFGYKYRIRGPVAPAKTYKVQDSE